MSQCPFPPPPRNAKGEKTVNKQIKCIKCGAYLGVIRDAKLRKDTNYICDKCVSEMDIKNKDKEYDFMGDIEKILRGSY